MRVICPGSFDPVTLGHLDVIARAARMFDEVIVAVGRNSSKRGRFTPAERVALIAESTTDLPGVSAVVLDGLLVDYCAEHGITAIVKGVRSAADVDHELQMAQMNACLTGVETVFLPTSPRHGFVSSTLVREISALGGDVTPFVPPAVARALARPRADDGG